MASSAVRNFMVRGLECTKEGVFQGMVDSYSLNPETHSVLPDDAITGVQGCHGF